MVQEAAWYLHVPHSVGTKPAKKGRHRIKEGACNVSPLARLGTAWLGWARLGTARVGSARLPINSRLGTARRGSALNSSCAPPRKSEIELQQLGAARVGTARLLFNSRLGTARLGSALNYSCDTPLPWTVDKELQQLGSAAAKLHYYGE